MIKIKLKRHLVDSGHNLKSLSEEAGIYYATLYNFANQKTTSVNYQMLNKICKTLKCEVSDIIEHQS